MGKAQSNARGGHHANPSNFAQGENVDSISKKLNGGSPSVITKSKTKGNEEPFKLDVEQKMDTVVIRFNPSVAESPYSELNALKVSTES